jgi:3'-5' exoribonuclease
MVRIARKVAPLYRVDIDLLLTGVFLHNIGKLEEIDSKYESDYTTAGNLIGHIVIGRDMVRDAVSKIKGFPEDLAQKVEHIILAHQGVNDWKSPKNPAFKEALLVHLIGHMDAKMSLMDIAYDEDQEQGLFTNRHNHFRIPLLKDNEP